MSVTRGGGLAGGCTAEAALPLRPPLPLRDEAADVRRDEAGLTNRRPR